jgi:hypothetical protein
MTLPIDERLAKKLDDQKKRDEIKQKNLEEYRKFRTALQAMCRDANGQIVLRHICKISGFWQTTIVKKGDGVSMMGVDVNGMLINEGRRSLYLDIRRPMSDEGRRLIESKNNEGDDHVENN